MFPVLPNRRCSPVPFIFRPLVHVPGSPEINVLVPLFLKSPGRALVPCHGENQIEA